MSNIGFSDGCWGQTPPCYYDDESGYSEYLAREVEAAFQEARAELIEEARRELDPEDWAEYLENHDYWERQWFMESADGRFSLEAWEAWEAWF